MGLVTSGSYNVLGNDGRCSMIGREIGFENIGVDANIDTSTHGNEASFEFIVEKAPDLSLIHIFRYLQMLCYIHRPHHPHSPLKE